MSREPNEKGIVVVLAAATLLIVLGMTALVTDAGILLMGRTDLAKAVDSAALAGAQEIPDNRRFARQIAVDYVNTNTSRTLYSEPKVQVSFPTGNAIRVRASMELPPMFSRVLGYSQLGVGATAIATRFDPDVALIIDRSGSMCWDTHPGAGANCPAVGPWEPFDAIRNASKGFVDQMASSGGTMAMISYATDATVDVPPTTYDAPLREAIDGLVPGGETDIGRSLDQAVELLLEIQGPNPKMIVLLTDGVPSSHNGRPYGQGHPIPVQAARDAAGKAADGGIPIYGISYGEGADQDLMNDIAETTGGKSYYAPNAEWLNVVYTEIADTAQIRLTYVD